MIDLALVWVGIIGLGVLIYVVMDGFDLGIGILFPFIQGQQERDVMMNTVAPVWDGNETWMVLGRGSICCLSTGLFHRVICLIFTHHFYGSGFDFPRRGF